MSSFCCINLIRNNISNNFKAYNKLAKQLIQFALDNDIAVFFNSYDYGEELIREANMKDFIIISDSFLYKNCELLNNTDFVRILSEKNITDYKNAFIIKYSVFQKILDIIFQYDVSAVELYITEDELCSISEFKKINSTKDKLIDDLYLCVENSVSEYGNEFPPIKFCIENK